jgi:hypothetical protein
MVSGEDVFYPSSSFCHFPLVRQEDAPFEVLFCFLLGPFVCGKTSDGLSDLDDFGSDDDDDDWGANPRFSYVY